jgi:HEAT repeat protein
MEQLECMLRDDDLNTRVEARLALTRRGKAAVPVLIAALSDERRDVRFEAAVALVNMQDPAPVQALPELIRCLRDEYWLVRLNALAAIASIGPPARDAVPEVRRMLNDEKPTLSRMAAAALNQIQGTDISSRAAQPEMTNPGASGTAAEKGE